MKCKSLIIFKKNKINIIYFYFYFYIVSGALTNIHAQINIF
jgi:hypothetical protein